MTKRDESLVADLVMYGVVLVFVLAGIRGCAERYGIPPRSEVSDAP